MSDFQEDRGKFSAQGWKEQLGLQPVELGRDLGPVPQLLCHLGQNTQLL